MSNGNQDNQPSKRGFFDAPGKTLFIMGFLAALVICLIVGVVLAFTVFKNSNSNTNKTANTNTNQVVKTSEYDNPTPYQFTITDQDHVKGDKNAKVTLVLFSDFQCPYCQRHEVTISQILSTFSSSQVRLVFKEYPLTQLHQYAEKAAEAAECASDQGKFWEMHDALFTAGSSSATNTNNSESGLSVANIKIIAKNLKLDTTKFNSCLDNGDKAQKVQDDIALGDKAGVNGTPANFINGKLISGAIPFADYQGSDGTTHKGLKSLIQAEL